MQGGYTYELSHDTLVAPVLLERAKRVKADREEADARLTAQRDAELAESKRVAAVERGKRRRAYMLTAIAIVGALGTIIGAIWANNASHRAERAVTEKLAAVAARDSAEKNVSIAKKAVDEAMDTVGILKDKYEKALNDNSLTKKERDEIRRQYEEAKQKLKEKDDNYYNALKQVKEAQDQLLAAIDKQRVQIDEAEKGLVLAQSREKNLEPTVGTASNEAITKQKMADDVPCQTEKEQMKKEYDMLANKLAQARDSLRKAQRASPPSTGFVAPNQSVPIVSPTKGTTADKPAGSVVQGKPVGLTTTSTPIPANTKPIGSGAGSPAVSTAAQSGGTSDKKGGNPVTSPPPVSGGKAQPPGSLAEKGVTEGTSSATSSKGGDIPMVFVKGGTFQMGSNDNDNEKPIHSVTVNDFYIGKYEVTQAQWRDVMGSDPSELNFKGCDQCPVERVSWNDIQDFLKKLNQKTVKKYRLPTEAEWEFASKGGTKSKGFKYSGSDNIDEVAWYDGNSDHKTHPVGTKKPNELGIYDMSGNVWEWCSDWYDGNYYSSSPSKNPTGAASGTYRVYRGGSWDYDAQYCRLTNRNNNYPTYRYDYVGFRVVFTP